MSKCLRRARRAHMFKNRKKRNLGKIGKVDTGSAPQQEPQEPEAPMCGFWVASLRINGDCREVDELDGQAGSRSSRSESTVLQQFICETVATDNPTEMPWPSQEEDVVKGERH